MDSNKNVFDNAAPTLPENKVLELLAEQGRIDSENRTEYNYSLLADIISLYPIRPSKITKAYKDGWAEQAKK